MCMHIHTNVISAQNSIMYEILKKKRQGGSGKGRSKKETMKERERKKRK